MEFLSTVQLRELKIRQDELSDIRILADVASYDNLVSFTGHSICLEGSNSGQVASTYPVTDKSRAEIYRTPGFLHYVFSDDNGFVRTFTMQRTAGIWINKFRTVSKAIGILKGEYDIDQVTVENIPDNG